MTEKYKNIAKEFSGIHKQVFVDALIDIAMNEENGSSIRVMAHKLRRSVGRYYLGNREDSLVDLAGKSDEEIILLDGVGPVSIKVIDRALGMVLERKDVG